jgi:hypothetical protein
MAAHFRPVSAAVLIPSRGRPEVLAKTLAKMPFLNDNHTYIAIQGDEWASYRAVREQYDRIYYIEINNPEGSVGVAREQLRDHAVRVRPHYQWYVATDDNARYTQESLTHLVQAAEAWRLKTKKVTFVCGMHSTAPHFDRNLIKKKETVDGWTTYPGINFIFHAIHNDWYAKYSYPPGCFALEDRHMMLAAINAGHTEFRVCMDAPYSKSRYQPGGQGDINKRRWNCGRSIEQLAHDFPFDVGVRGTFPLPWQMIRKLRAGVQVDRLMGGSMRKEAALERPVGKLKAKIRKRS